MIHEFMNNAKIEDVADNIYILRGAGVCLCVQKHMCAHTWRSKDSFGCPYTSPSLVPQEPSTC